MKNLFAINFPEMTITASKTTLKKASVPNSAEYKELMKLMKQNPGFSIVEKEIKQATGKKTYRGLTDALIKKYISIQPNSAELEKQYKKAFEMGKFPLVRKWFLDTFEDFDVEEAKEKIAKITLAEITSADTKSEDQPAEQKVVDMPAAVNQK